ncbi:BREX-1 system adenine-specific DNA-methyltransferase PglX [Clostridium kluyveri]|uniref:BREX-1 system adenine-specific DNA-methyltransferase PglX n=1 Tax=Clostridium kluyveri TaxID=1534 RepID=UPI00224834C4|nr:BREX-1 system adenine-specific DNA-methyltransferase PglX [Clostridium kluyveri]UZQ50249.1 BREX-1 system adenine-specific DNA-methyltransferase PglX [Clostridium kluyveri]
MNKNVLKNFAVKSRKELVEKVKIRAATKGIEKDYIENLHTIRGFEETICSEKEKLQIEMIINRIESLNKNGEKGYDIVIEEIAYSWFNRFIALRFMEVNKYIPETFIVKYNEYNSMQNINGINFSLDLKKIQSMRLSEDAEGLLKYMVLSRCSDLKEFLPFVFQGWPDYTELLFPEELLGEKNFVFRLIHTIPEKLWYDVEIIGWLYEYYISEEQNRIISSKKKYTKQEIPYATQLFTPDWIVKYMVQNSLGRYWIEAHPEHQALKKRWEFYIENLEPQQELKSYIDKDLKARDIKCVDPACGSGHILVYMFRLLYQIYRKCGYGEDEIPEMIIQNNIYGMDIHDGACQLACFIIGMEGMKYDRCLLEKIKRKAVKFNIVSIRETNNFSDEDIKYVLGDNYNTHYNILKNFIDQFKDAKIYGSLIELREFKEDILLNRLEYIKSLGESNLLREKRRKQIIGELSKLIKQARIMWYTYDILVTNPPYISNKYLPELLAKYIGKNYPEAKSDIFSAFMAYGFSKVKYNGQLAFMTPFVWMFIQSYQKLREKIIDYKSITSLIQLEYSGFEEATVPICTFTLRNYKVNMKGSYIKLSDFKGSNNQPVKVREAVDDPHVNYRFTLNQDKMKSIPGSRFGYWLTRGEIEILSRASIIGDVAFPCTGMQTGNNNKYIRHWFEVKYKLINFKGESNNIKYWIPYQMGGEARKWYGNISEVIYWRNNGEKVRREQGSLIRNEKFFFKKGISWKRITSGNNTIRVLNKGFIFDQSADSIFVKNPEDYNYILAFFNTKIMMNIFKFISPTLNLTAGTVKQIPIYIEKDPDMKKKINDLCEECISISKMEWDFFETSWNFKKHPFILMCEDRWSLPNSYDSQIHYYIGHIFNIWESFAENQFNRLKQKEEELNKIFIHIYGLQDELTPEVLDKDITIRRADKKRDVKSFISYGVGCMFGRYSIDREGVICSDEGIYSFCGQKNTDFTRYLPDEDNIIPILCHSCFKNDIVDRFIQFVSVVFGKETLYENLSFIANTLGKKEGETDEDTLRRYFINNFFKDHVQIYKKRPIYWLFTSGKYKAFNCLVYVHRYHKGVLSIIRNCYVNKIQDKIYKDIQFLSYKMEHSCEKEKKDIRKKLDILYKKQDELNIYDEMLISKANMNIELELDLGIIANYKKFLPLVKNLEK